MSGSGHPETKVIPGPCSQSAPRPVKMGRQQQLRCWRQAQETWEHGSPGEVLGQGRLSLRGKNGPQSWSSVEAGPGQDGRQGKSFLTSSAGANSAVVYWVPAVLGVAVSAEGDRGVLEAKAYRSLRPRPHPGRRGRRRSATCTGGGHVNRRHPPSITHSQLRKDLTHPLHHRLIKIFRPKKNARD